MLPEKIILSREKEFVRLEEHIQKQDWDSKSKSSYRGGKRSIIIEKYRESYPNGMTQKEFFETELGADLNTTLKTDDNFWRSDRRGRVILTKEGATLNLNRSLENKILKKNMK